MSRTAGPIAALRTADAFGLAVRLALVVLLLDGSPYWYHRVPMLLCAGAGLVLPGLAASAGLWLLLAALSAWPLVGNFPFSDNHDYLRAILCVAAACACLARDPGFVLARSARWLVAGVFGFAVLWKLVLSPDFVDTTFFRVTLLSDARFVGLVVLADGQSREQWEANAERFWDALRSGDDPTAAGFVEPPRVRRLALAATLGTALAELWVALAFLWPVGRGPSRTRDAALLLFALATYPVAPVRGFGWLLMVLGIASSDPSAWRTRCAYLLAFGAIALFGRMPLGDWLA
jgi:hypothetical protein